MERSKAARLLRRLVAVAGVALAPGVLAAPCAGFTDLDTSSAFCANVEWLKNREITQGCTSATVYCPNSPVGRLAMAAFMNRLGTALTPLHVPVEVSPGAIDLDASLVVCQTQDLTVTGYPRRAYVDVSFGATAAADTGFAADLAMSTNGGGTWTDLNTASNRGFARANQWGAVGDVGFADLAVGVTVRFGVRMSRGGVAGGTDLSDSRCQLRVLLHSRTGAGSPL